MSCGLDFSGTGRFGSCVVEFCGGDADGFLGGPTTCIGGDGAISLLASSSKELACAASCCSDAVSGLPRVNPFTYAYAGCGDDCSDIQL